MSTELLEHGDLILTRFAGGRDHGGVCYQLNVGSDYVVLTKEQAELVVSVLVREPLKESNATKRHPCPKCGNPNCKMHI